MSSRRLPPVPWPARAAAALLLLLAVAGCATRRVPGPRASQAGPPRVLLLGDSISIGYTPSVRAALDGEALVFRPMLTNGRPENCEGTTRGMAAVERWLAQGNGQWDVIHFNFGLHDLKHVDPVTGANSNLPEHPHQADPATYERQLGRIVERLKRTGATLICATTTPVPGGGVRPYRSPADVDVYNAVARRVAARHGVRVNDLNAFVTARLGEWQQPVNVHFHPAGSEALGREVAGHVRRALRERTHNTRASRPAFPNVVVFLADDLGCGACP